MNLFDRICAVLAFVLAIVFVLLGIIGLFTGCSANFTLPPVLGAVPALVGWGIIRPILLAWRIPSASSIQPPGFEVIPPPHRPNE